ncbi:winged helix-turn-helix domain-containing protein [Cohnella sp. GCM10020058]|uniref:winged helix-turn-helix domain-containing protein n=1 Tax=Cohnella sp. GCM10020058 TaxID=3317330 RepID=UPI003643F876
MKKTILIVDDEEKIREVLLSYLQHNEFDCVEAATGKDALITIAKERIALVILDLMLPDLSGEEVCRKIRQISSVPILMLTAKIADENRIHGLSIGADDYVIKPFNPREVIARVKVILRRTQDDALLSDHISFGDGELVIDAQVHEVTKLGEQVNLTPNEFKLLVAMAKRPERVFTREQLIDIVLGYEFVGDVRTIDQHIKNLRQKIEMDPKYPQYIVTVYGVGYRFAGGN